tara:strand:- start:45 stop:236 length:192 start_codon:yes stop_codon:yes gene_type:complete
LTDKFDLLSNNRNNKKIKTENFANTNDNFFRYRKWYITIENRKQQKVIIDPHPNLVSGALNQT